MQINDSNNDSNIDTDQSDQPDQRNRGRRRGDRRSGGRSESTAARTYSKSSMVPIIPPSPSSYSANPALSVSSLPSARKVELKMILLGDGNTGKTSLMNKLAFNKAPRSHTATIGVGIGLCKRHDSVHNVDVDLIIWDIAGQDRFNSVMPMYVRGAHCAFVVYDISDKSTFESASTWKQQLDTLLGNARIPVVLVGNKCDLNCGAMYDEDFLQSFCRDNGFIAWFEMSVLTGENLEQALAFTISHTISELGSRMNGPDSNVRENVSTKLIACLMN